jgi:hypothetical protein
MDEGQYRFSALEMNSGSNCDSDGEFLYVRYSATRVWLCSGRFRFIEPGSSWFAFVAAHFSAPFVARQQPMAV